MHQDCSHQDDDSKYIARWPLTHFFIFIKEYRYLLFSFYYSIGLPLGMQKLTSEVLNHSLNSSWANIELAQSYSPFINIHHMLT